jgi:hypothetical protein
MATQKQFGGWYPNPQAGGQSQRYWGGDVWTTGSDPTGGLGPNWQSIQGSQSTPTTAGASGSFQLQPTGIAGSQDIIAAQNKQLQDLMSSYTGMQEKAGIPGLQSTVQGYETQISNVQNLLNQLEGNINERTKGTMTTEAQRQRMLASEQTPLRNQLGVLGQALAPAEQALSTAQSTVKDQLDVYLNAIQNQQALTMEQMREASTLAQQEQQFENQKQLFSYEQAPAPTPTFGATPSLVYGGQSTGTTAKPVTITEQKPTYKVGQWQNAISPQGQWTWNGSDWVPRI